MAKLRIKGIGKKKLTRAKLGDGMSAAAGRGQLAGKKRKK